MDPLASDEVGVLIVNLVETANACGDAHALLHERVTLNRLDGTSITGRDAVADAIQTRGTEARFAVLGRLAGSVYVALTIEGIPGRLVFTMTGALENGRLIEIWMDQEEPSA